MTFASVFQSRSSSCGNVPRVRISSMIWPMTKASDALEYSQRNIDSGALHKAGMQSRLKPVNILALY